MIVRDRAKMLVSPPDGTYFAVYRQRVHMVFG